jgi:hypothetical protein
MSDPQSIIVYRNPAEAALWEGGMVWPIMVGAFFAIIAGIIAAKLADGRVKDASIPAVIVMVIVFIAVLKFMGAV